MKLATKTLVVGSGKGGVGKSTVTVNLAVAAAQLGLSVGVLDADVYGPSIPIMLGLRQISPPKRTLPDGSDVVLPFSKFGIHAMSIGFFMLESQASLWRGPMLHGALAKMLGEVCWPTLDLLLIDLPPGTGDVPMSLSQQLELDGAVVVSTPQEVAILDAIKAINALDLLKVPLVGIVENMAGFQDPSGQVHHIFGQGKAEELARRFHVPLLGSLPLNPEIRRGSDEGVPAALTPQGSPFKALAETLIGELDGINRGGVPVGSRDQGGS